MMEKLWVVLLVALTGAHFGQGLPLRSTPQSYPHNTDGAVLAGWGENNLYSAVPALALIVTAFGFLFGCTWCYRHKDCKQNRGADNQLFTATATHLHERRSHPPDSGFSEPANNNISEDNNNGPISLREMQNIANNNAGAYIVSENEERNRVSRESVVEFEPLPTGIRVADPLERCVDWFGDEDFPRHRLQYLREIGRGWFGRVVEGEIEDEGTATTVAVKILNQNASLEDKARFLDEARLYRDASHENVLAFVASCLQEDPWILIFELCSTDLQNYLTENHPKMAELNESGVPLRLMCDVTSALSYLHSRGYTYGELCTRNVLVRGSDAAARAVLGHYGVEPTPRVGDAVPHMANDVSALGALLRDICAWGASPPPAQPDCPYGEHLQQVMQLCWHENAESRPSAAQVQALLEHLHSTHLRAAVAHDDGYGSSDFEERWQRLKPNTIPKLDEHRALVHAPSTSVGSHFTGEFPARDSLTSHMDTAVSRSSSIMSDKDPLQIKSESLTNLHGSLEDVRNIYLTHNEQAVLECHQANTSLEDTLDEDASVDPWLKDIIAGSHDDVSYYKDVSDVIKNLDNILNSEKTSSSESSHQASPSRDNLSLDCKKDYPMQSSMVKSPGITNFQNILEVGFEDRSPEKRQDEDEDRDTVGTLSHSFERHSDTTSQHTLENLTPDTPIRDMELPLETISDDLQTKLQTVERSEDVQVDAVLPKESKIDNSDSVKTDLCKAPIHSDNEVTNVSEDCRTLSDSKLTDIVNSKETVEAKSISEINEPVCDRMVEVNFKTVQSLEQNVPVNVRDEEVLPVYPDIVKDNKNTDLLPNAPLEETHVTDSQPEVSSTNSQKVINNDLITPAESTTDSKITPTELEPSAEVENLDNVSQIALEPHRREGMKHNESSLSSFDIKEKPEKPESVQSISTALTERDIKDDVIEDLVSIIKSDVSDSKSNHEELVKFLENETMHTTTTSSVTTPILILSEVQDDTQISKDVDKVPEEFVDKIIKEAETAALHCIEIAHTKIGVPESLNISKDTFSTNDNKAASLQVLIEPVTSQEDSLNKYLKKEAKLAQASGLDHIAKVILHDAIQDVPKAMQKGTSPDFFLENNLVLQTPILNSNLENCTNTLLTCSGSEALPDIVRNVTINKGEPITEAQHENEITDKQIQTQSVVPQLSLEPTASADSSQCTFLIKDTLKEDSKAVYESPKDALLNEPAQVTMVPELSAEAVLSTFHDLENEVTDSILMPEDRPNTNYVPPILKDETEMASNIVEETIGKDNISEQNTVPKSDNTAVENVDTQSSNNSTAYMDLTDNIKNKIIEQRSMDETVKDIINHCLETPGNESCSLVKNESTMYLDLPNVIRDTVNFLHAERQIGSHTDDKDPLCSSTPKSSADDSSPDSSPDSVVEKSDVLSETKVPDYGPGVTLTKLEQQCVPDFMSPFDSPTKSHPTDTYDENSSVVLGPFENCTMDLFKGVKSGTDLVDMPKEEMFAFSSNFSEMNLETPSPLRDGNFLNEVPDIVHDDSHFDDIITDPKDEIDAQTEASDATDKSITERKVSPSTPPNSPGYFLASTSQQKYLVDIDLNQPTEPAPIESDSGLSSLHKEIELNQIELQITSKLAMAENENNLNIEYSGPLTVEGLVQNDLTQEEESAPETFLAGNGGNIDNIREMFTLNEDCVNALRNELELKLPLAQVAAIEPARETETESDTSGPWTELPPPPELVVSYPGALSPIAEETGPQLSAYDNDVLWNASLRTESSESYPSPCNNSTEEPTEPPTGHSRDTYSLPGPQACTQPQTSSREITMSADSLNASPANTAIDDRTFTVEEAPCERISQVSPFVLSPTTDSTPRSEVTGVSTLSKTTQPTDANISKPSETISKTSIDSWCSNDTLYNVEEAFDDLASDPELLGDPENDNSESSHTLTLNEDKELSHVSTYIVHDSSDEDRFSPDSITANDNGNYTYTKAKTEVTSPSAETKSEVNSKTQTKDLAYGTMLSGPSYSNCTTEQLSAEKAWLFPHPELVRRSPVEPNVEVFTVSLSEPDPDLIISPQLKSEPCIKKMDSVEITCLEDHLLGYETSPRRDSGEVEVHDSPNCHYEIDAGVTSTPLSEIPSEERAELSKEVEVHVSPNCHYEIDAGVTSTSLSEIPSEERAELSKEVEVHDSPKCHYEMDAGVTSTPLSEIPSEERAELSKEVEVHDSPKCHYEMDAGITSTPLSEIPSEERAELSKEDEVLDSPKCHYEMDAGVTSTPLSEIPSEERAELSKEVEVHDSPKCLYEMDAGITSTPLSEIPSEEGAELVQLQIQTMTPDNLPDNIHYLKYQSFMLSAEMRHQGTERPAFPYLPEGSEDSLRLGPDATPSFIEFMQAATTLPQETSWLQSSQNGSGDFDRFEKSMLVRPQDLSTAEVLREKTSVANEDSTRPSQPSPEPTAIVLSPPSITNYKESHVGKVSTVIITDLEEDETEQPHSIIIAEISKEKDSPNRTFESPIGTEMNHTYDSHLSRRHENGAMKEYNSDNSKDLTINGINESNDLGPHIETKSSEVKPEETKQKHQTLNKFDTLKDIPNGSNANLIHTNDVKDIKCNGNRENFATVNFISEAFEELLESNVDDGDCKDIKTDEENLDDSVHDTTLPLKDSPTLVPALTQDPVNGVEEKMVAVTEDFLQNEKKFCQLDSYLPLLSDIRFTGPASEIMSTSFTQDSPTEPEPERDDKPGADMKEWDSDTESHSSNSSSGEFIWKGGDGQETSVVPTTQFDHRGSNGTSGGRAPGSAPGSGAASGSGSGSGSEGDEVEFVPSSWDCRAEPAKSSLRSLPYHSQDNKKRVVFKRQKYHCVYEYPRELATVDADSPAYLPDLSTYTEWDAGSAEEAEMGYGQLFGAASPLDLYPLRGTIAFGADYDEDFFISSSARPFESLGVMSTTSQFFPGMRLKPDLDEEDFPPPPSPLAPLAPLAQTRTPSLDFTTPDSGVEDITPGSTSTDEDFKTKKLPESEVSQWRSIDSGSSSESVSPSSPGGEALGGLRHTRDKLKLDLPPSPHIPSPRHNRVFNFVLDKPKRRAADERPAPGTTPIVMTDETPVASGALPVSTPDDVPVPEPTFSTFGKSLARSDPEQKIILTDDADKTSPVKEPVRGEGTVLDSGDEDSGIESTKATLERKTPNVS